MLPALDIVMLVSIGLIEFFRCMNVAVQRARHAGRPRPDPGGARDRHQSRLPHLLRARQGAAGDGDEDPGGRGQASATAGLLHVWLLDEGDDPEVKEVCARLGVHHFSRKGVAKWNQPKGPHRAKTKHGNYNAWLDAHGDDYDFFASVDTDHVPLPNYLERMLGFFRDPDVGFVIGPQVYGNYDNAVTKAAESQQFLFHALIQRAGNALRRPDVRRHLQRRTDQGAQADRRPVRLDHRGHGHRLRDAPPPEPGDRAGSGARSTPRTCSRSARARAPGRTSSPSRCAGRGARTRRSSSSTGRAAYSLPPSKLFNYTMMIIFYPMSALNWILAALSCALFLGLGASGVNIDPTVWLMLYGNASALQIGLYVWNRRHNVSPARARGLRRCGRAW